MRSLLPHSPISGLDLCLREVSLWHQRAGGSLSPAAQLLHCCPGPRCLRQLLGVPPACLCPPASANLWGQPRETWISPLPSCADRKQAASGHVLAVLRLLRWFPVRGAGLPRGNPWGLDCPRLSQQLPTPSPGRLEHLSPSSGSCWTEEPLYSLFGEVPGTCRGIPAPSQRTDAWLRLGPARCLRGVSVSPLSQHDVSRSPTRR